MARRKTRKLEPNKEAIAKAGLATSQAIHYLKHAIRVLNEHQPQPNDEVTRHLELADKEAALIQIHTGP